MDLLSLFAIQKPMAFGSLVAPSKPLGGSRTSMAAQIHFWSAHPDLEPLALITYTYLRIRINPSTRIQVTGLESSSVEMAGVILPMARWLSPLALLGIFVPDTNIASVQRQHLWM
jgi:hypothetical protein